MSRGSIILIVPAIPRLRLSWPGCAGRGLGTAAPQENLCPGFILGGAVRN